MKLKEFIKAISTPDLVDECLDFMDKEVKMVTCDDKEHELLSAYYHEEDNVIYLDIE